MSIASGSFYYPFENLAYAFSVLRQPSPSSDALIARIRALADLIETIVLSDRVVFDYEDENQSDTYMYQLIGEFGLQSVLLPFRPQSVSLEEHAPNTLMPVAQDIHDDVLLEYLLRDAQRPDSTLLYDMFENPRSFSQTAVMAVIQSLIKNTPVQILAGRKREVFDYIRVVDEVLGLGLPIDPEQGIASWSELIDQLEQGALPRDLEATAQQLTLSIFHLLTDSALTTAFREGAALQPYELQSQLILAMPVFAPSSKVFLDKVDQARQAEAARLNDFVHSAYSRTVSFPILFEYVLSQARSLKDLFQVALDLRERREVRRYRSWCALLDSVLRQGAQRDAVNMIAEADEFIASLTRCVSSTPKMQLQISFPPAAIFEVPLAINGRKQHLVFLKQVYADTRTPFYNQRRIAEIFGL